MCVCVCVCVGFRKHSKIHNYCIESGLYNQLPEENSKLHNKLFYVKCDIILIFVNIYMYNIVMIDILKIITQLYLDHCLSVSSRHSNLRFLLVLDSDDYNRKCNINNLTYTKYPTFADSPPLWSP